jgi:hypothetical protein
MKSINEWRMSHNDPDWEQIKRVWGTGNKPIDPKILSMVKPKIERIQDQYTNYLKLDSNIKSFRDVPPKQRDQLAQAIVVATLSAFYNSLETTGGSNSTMSANDFKKMAKPEQLPQDVITAPQGWEGN